MRQHDPPIPVTPGVFSIMSIQIPPKEPCYLVLEQLENDEADQGVPKSTAHRLWGRFEFDRKITIFRVDDLNLYEQPREGWYKTPLVWRAAYFHIDTGSVSVDDESQIGWFGYRDSEGADPAAGHILDTYTRYTVDLSGGGLHYDCDSLYGSFQSSFKNDRSEMDLLQEIKVQWESLGVRGEQRRRQRQQEEQEDAENNSP